MLLPEFSREFHISPAAASLSLSLTTIALAVSMLFVGSLSEVKGRKPLMIFSLLAASLLAVLIPFVPNYYFLLFVRVLQGLVLAGLPAVAMAYLSEEIAPANLGIAMGLYISGNSVGGMSGRIFIGMLSDYFNWRIALGSIVKILGIAIFTFGFFGSHSLASSWVGHRAIHDKAQASALYLFFYYAGSSICGTVGGISWSTFGWGGVICMILGFLLLALFLSLRLNSISQDINQKNQQMNYRVKS